MNTIRDRAIFIARNIVFKAARSVEAIVLCLSVRLSAPLAVSKRLNLNARLRYLGLLLCHLMVDFGASCGIK